jgi:Metallo-beta-lactamase superfamily
MKRYGLAGVVVLLLATSFVSAQGRGQAGGRGANEPPPINYNTKMPWSSWEAGVNTWWANFPREAQGVEPFKIFDNLYYVGIQTGQALLIPTTDGLILIDATWAETADLVLNSIRKAGFDPANIKYILISHGHGDHFAGVGRIKQVAVNARIGTSAADWELIESQQGRPESGLPFKRDLVINDSDVIKLGDMALKIYVTPGHSAGALAFDIPARIGKKTYRILNPRVGIRIPANMTEAYIKSMERLKALGPWDGYLPEHSFLSMRTAQISPRDFYLGPAPLPKPAGPNASVQGAAAVNAFFDEMLKVAREKLAAEQKSRPQTQ